jgi:hypothetical protein
MQTREITPVIPGTLAGQSGFHARHALEMFPLKFDRIIMKLRYVKRAHPVRPEARDGSAHLNRDALKNAEASVPQSDAAAPAWNQHKAGRGICPHANHQKSHCNLYAHEQAFASVGTIPLSAL